VENAMYVGLLLLAAVYFFIFNTIFDVFYFGCAGVGTVFIGCFVLALITVVVFASYWPWILGIGAIIFFLVKKGKEES